MSCARVVSISWHLESSETHAKGHEHPGRKIQERGLARKEWPERASNPAGNQVAEALYRRD